MPRKENPTQPMHGFAGSCLSLRLFRSWAKRIISGQQCLWRDSLTTTVQLSFPGSFADCHDQRQDCFLTALGCHLPPVSSRGCQLSLGSLVFAASKFKEDPGRLKTTVECALGRNERNRLRVVSMKVNMTLGVAPESLAHLSQTLSQFEDFCTVPQSVQAGIPFTVTVKGPNGRVVK